MYSIRVYRANVLRRYISSVIDADRGFNMDVSSRLESLRRPITPPPQPTSASTAIARANQPLLCTYRMCLRVRSGRQKRQDKSRNAFTTTKDVPGRAYFHASDAARRRRASPTCFAISFTYQVYILPCVWKAGTQVRTCTTVAHLLVARTLLPVLTSTY